MTKNYTINDQVKLERVQQLYSQNSIATLGSVACAFAAYFVINSESSPPTWLGYWLLAILSTSIYRTVVSYQFKKSDIAPEAADRWANRIVLLEWISGLTWGIVTLGFVDLNLLQQVFLAIVIAGLVSGATITYSAYFLAAAGFNFTSLSFLAFSFFYFGQNETTFGAGAVSVVYSLLMIMLAHNSHHRLVQQIRLKFENFNLAEELKQNNLKLQRESEHRQVVLQELKNSKEKYQSLYQVYDGILRNLPIGVIRLNHELRITYINPEMNKILGTPEGELNPSLGKVISEQEPILKTGFAGLFKDVQQGKNLSVETKYTSLYGKVSEISVQMVPFMENEIFSGGLLLVQDIAEQLAAKESIIAAKNEAEKASQTKSAFLANVSHELRTPLHGILGISELLDGTKLDDDQRHYVRLIRSSGSALLDTVNQVLDLSRIEKGLVETNCEVCDLRSFLQNTFTPLINDIQKKGITFKLEIDEALPNRLMVDTFHLQHILQNLLHNAFKFTDYGTINLKVSSRPVTEQSHHLIFSVTDTGIGISEDQQEKVFEAFTQLDQGSQRRYTGTGLGMAITRQMLQLLDSDIKLQSEPGKGSTFSFELEMNQPSAVELDVNDSDNPNSRSTDVSNVRVLVVDDNPVNRMIASRVLLRQGYQVDQVESGLQAIDAVKDLDYDLILMDIDMPQMDGIETTKQIRALHSTHIPVIAMTAHTMHGDKERFLDAGMDGYIAKPFEKEDLFQVINSHTH